VALPDDDPADYGTDDIAGPFDGIIEPIGQREDDDAREHLRLHALPIRQHPEQWFGDDFRKVVDRDQQPDDGDPLRRPGRRRPAGS